jgi:D-arabinose 1-dehydrogenase-like Zn-dependent alcohol dehydrogenase
MPSHVSFVEAAALTCAGVTAWNALFGGGRGKEILGEGGWVLTQGTGMYTFPTLPYPIQTRYSFLLIGTNMSTTT